MCTGKVINASSGWLPVNTYRRWRTMSFIARAFVDHQTLGRRQTNTTGRERERASVANIVNKEPPINRPRRCAKHGASDNTDYIYAVYAVFIV